MYRRNACALCSGHGKHHPVGQCQRPECGAMFCAKHGTWDSESERWLCLRCARNRAA